MNANTSSICITTVRNNVYMNCLIAISIVHAITTLVLDSIKQNYASPAEIAIITICLLLELILVIVECKILYKYIFLTDIKPIFCLYISKTLAFSDIYLLMYKINHSHFDIPDEFNMNNNSSYLKLTITFINYSISCQTLTGISSVSPKTILAELLTSTQ
eukprot:165017_1